MRPRPHRPRPWRRRRRGGPRFIPYAMEVPVPVYDEVDYSEDDTLMDAYLDLLDAQSEEDEAVMGMEEFGGSKWKNKYKKAKRKRVTAEKKLKACKARAEKASEKEDEEPVAEPTMEDGEESTPAPQEAPSEEPAEEPEEPEVDEAAELAKMEAEWAQEDQSDEDWEGGDEDEFGILTQETTSMGRPPGVLDVFAARLASVVHGSANIPPMQQGGLTEPGEYSRFIHPRGVAVEDHDDLQGYLDTTDDLVESIRSSYAERKW